MRKIYFYCISIVALLLLQFMSYSQVSISGPTCVVPGTAYSYKVTGAWAAKSTMQLCITGGMLAAKDSSLRNCTPNAGAPLGAVTVTWSGKGQGTITVNSPAGTGTLSVNITTPLQAGSINTKTKKQVIGYDSLPGMIVCAPDTGGSCSPKYAAQWQQSFDINNWTDIKGATDQNLLVNTPLTQSLFYRRKTVEITSGTIAYSDVAVVYVIPIAQQIEDSIKAAKTISAFAIIPDKKSATEKQVSRAESDNSWFENLSYITLFRQKPSGN